MAVSIGSPFVTVRDTSWLYGAGMDTNPIHAMTRFGLGRRASEPLPTDPVGWLLGQLRADGAPRIDPFPNTQTGLAALNGLITRQAAMVAYIDAFYMTAILCLLCLPLVLLLQSPKRKAAVAREEPAHAVME